MQPFHVFTRARRTTADEFVVTGKRTVTGDGFKVELDLSSQVLAIKVPIDWDSYLATRGRIGHR
jgi:hypothetical protein